MNTPREDDGGLATANNKGLIIMNGRDYRNIREAKKLLKDIKKAPSKEKTMDDIISEHPKMAKQALESLELAIALIRELHHETGENRLLKLSEDLEGEFNMAYPDFDLRSIKE